MELKDSQTNAEQIAIFIKQGYQLDTPLHYHIPNAITQHTKLHSFFNIFGRQPEEAKLFDKKAAKVVSVLNDKILLLAQSNKLNIIYYDIKNNALIAESLGCYFMKEKIRKIKASFYQENVQNLKVSQYFVVEYVNSSRFCMFRISDLKKITMESEMRESDEIVCLRFINATELVMLLRNNSICHYVISEHKLKKMPNQLKITIREDQRLISAQLCNTFVKKKLKILLFYSTFNKNNQQSQIHMKELQKDSSNVCLQDFATYYNVFPVNMEAQKLKQLLIYSHKSILLFHFGLKIYVIQNRFGKFVNTDIIMELSNIKKLVVMDRKEHLFVSSISQDSIQLWEIVQKEVGCKCILLDKILTNHPQLYSVLLKTWIFIKHKQPNFALILDDGEKSIIFHLTKKEDKLTKLINQIKHEQQKSAKEQGKNNKKGKLKQIQELSKKLGFENRQFYLKLWHSVDKNSQRIYEYLLPCLDFRVIYKELTLYLRHKKLAVSEIIKILKKIESLILSQLQRKIDLELIKQFIKTNFQRRKLKFYSGDLQFDLELYQKLYESSIFALIQKSIDINLFPQKFKHDIVWKEQKLQIPLPISYILREFRLFILEDYPKFLITVLEPYKCYLRQIIQEYPYILPQYPLKISIIKEQLVMLSNIYQEQKIEEHQYSWLQYIRQKEWEREHSSFHFLYSHLFKFHPTSLIIDQLKELKESPWFKKNKYHKHSCIELNQEEYTIKLPTISQVSSILFFCQKANRISLEEGISNQTPDILDIMKNVNHLPLVQYEKFTLYSKLHHFLISQTLINTSITIKDLSEMQNYKIIVIFFLGDKQRIDLIFNKIYHFYPSKVLFTKVIQDFIISEQCSKIELELLVNYMKEMRAEEQHEHAEIIGIIITGFFKKIELRQQEKAMQFLRLFKNIDLSLQMIRKIAIFESIKTDCAHILKLFGMGNFTYEEIIQDNSKIINCLIDEYFSKIIRLKKCLYIEGRQINLQYPLNIFVVYLYLKDKIYSYLPQLDLHLQFCEKMLGWNQVSLIRQCYSGEIVIDDELIEPEQFYEIVVSFMLDKYNADQTLIYTAQFKDHLKDLLSLLEEQSQVFIIENNKLELVNIFENKLGQVINYQFMSILRTQWQQQEERSTLFREIVDIFEKNMDFKTFCRVYELLEKIKYGFEEVTIKTREFTNFVDFYCRKMFKIDRYDEICLIIHFLNNGEDSYQAKYNVMTQCFLKILERNIKSIKLKARSERNHINFNELLQTKTLIDYYIHHYDNIANINRLFQRQFMTKQDQLEQSPISELSVDPKLINNNEEEVFIQNHKIWQTITHRYSPSIEELMLNGSKKDISYKKKEHIEQQLMNYMKIIISSYHFICRSFSDLESIINVEEVSYHHLEQISILYEFERIPFFNKNIHFKDLYYQYLRSLFKTYYIESMAIDSQTQIAIEQDVQKMTIEQEHKEKMKEKDAALKIKEILTMQKAKLLILASDINQSSPSQLYKAIKRLISIIQQVPIVESQIIKEKPSLKSQHSFQSITHQIQFTYPSANLLPNSQASIKQNTYKYIQFSKIKQEYAKGSLVTQKYLIQKVIDELYISQDKHAESLELIPLSNNIITQLFADDKSANIIAYHQQENYHGKYQQNVDLNHIQSLTYHSQIGQHIKRLVFNREYEKIHQTYERNIVFRFVLQEFYRDSSIGGHSAQKNIKRKISRVNTLKQSSFSSRIVALLQLFDDLKLNQRYCKAKMLRSCLIILSSVQIQTIQPILFKTFTLNILTNTHLDSTYLFNRILSNIGAIHEQIQLQHYLIIVKIVDLFILKTKEEQAPKSLLESSIKMINMNSSNSREVGLLYREYVCRMMLKAERKDKLKDIQVIVGKMEKDQLSYIHNQLLELLENDEHLYFSYIGLVLDKFGNDFN